MTIAKMTIWSLFDSSGLMIERAAEMGHKCYCLTTPKLITGHTLITGFMVAESAIAMSLSIWTSWTAR